MSKENGISRIKSIKTPSQFEYYVDISSAKGRRKFIERIKNICRSSLEYKDYIGYLKDNIGLDHCAFFPEVTNNDGTRRSRHITIELHHDPLTLDDIVSVVVEKFYKEGLELNEFLIADEVMELHYNNEVGLIPLSKTAHQLVHNSHKAVIPLHLIYGRYVDFLERYEKYIDEDSEIYKKIERRISQMDEMTEESFDAICKQYEYIEVKGFDDIEKMELKEDSNNVKEEPNIDDENLKKIQSLIA
jgi:hypothetical protein